MDRVDSSNDSRLFQVTFKQHWTTPPLQSHLKKCFKPVTSHSRTSWAKSRFAESRTCVHAVSASEQPAPVQTTPLIFFQLIITFTCQERVIRSRIMQRLNQLRFLIKKPSCICVSIVHLKTGFTRRRCRDRFRDARFAFHNQTNMFFVLQI